MSNSRSSFTGDELSSLGALCSVFGLRMIGLFIVLPVLSPFAMSLSGSSSRLIGLAMGAYGLSQTILQVPYGWLSDRYGRKPFIVLGMVLFAAGSLWAAFTDHIWGLIGARFLQGSGAIAAVIIALIADLTRDEVRTRAMALIGGSVGLAFGLGFVAGPFIAGRWGVPMIFEITAGLSVIAIFVVLAFVPTPDREQVTDDVNISVNRLGKIFAQSDLWRLNGGIFLLHTSMTALFVVLPFMLQDLMSERNTWLLYLPVLLISGIVMFPSVFIAEKKGRVKLLTMTSLLGPILGLAVLGFAPVSMTTVFVGLALFITGFSLLEAVVPSLLTQRAPDRDRGTAVGVFNMSQFLGSFLGGILGGEFLHGYTWMLFVTLIVAYVGWGFIMTRLTYPETTNRFS